MVAHLQNPPPEFADVIKAHFYLKKKKILEASYQLYILLAMSFLACSKFCSSKAVSLAQKEMYILIH